MEVIMTGLLQDELTNNSIPFNIDCQNGRINISFAGYGECNSKDGYGFPLYVELHNKKLIVRVWSDISDEEPTHCIDMSGALEKNRARN